MTTELKRPPSILKHIKGAQIVFFSLLVPIVVLQIVHAVLHTNSVPHNEIWNIVDGFTPISVGLGVLLAMGYVFIVSRVIAYTFAPKIQAWVYEKYDLQLTDKQAFVLARQIQPDKANRDIMYLSAPLTMYALDEDENPYPIVVYLTEQQGEMMLISMSNGEEFQTAEETFEQEALVEFVEETIASEKVYVFINPDEDALPVATLPSYEEVYGFWSSEEAILHYQSTRMISLKIEAFPVEFFVNRVMPYLAAESKLVGINWDGTHQHSYTADYFMAQTF